MSITRSRSGALPRAGFPLAAVLLLGACSGPMNDGPQRTESRDVGDFHAIDLRGAANLQLEVGPAPSIRITAGEKVLANLRTEVRDGRLLVKQDRSWFWNHGEVRLQVTVPELREVTLRGAGNIRVKGVRGDSLVLTLQGAGNLVAEGAVGKLEVTINGAGNADLERLQARSASVTANGTGSVRVQATEALRAVVNGVGQVRYVGTPQKLDTQVNGVGSIAPASAKGS